MAHDYHDRIFVNLNPKHSALTVSNSFDGINRQNLAWRRAAQAQDGVLADFT
jgi:hypothetical protein